MTMRKPVNSRVSSRRDKWWKLKLFADVAAAMAEYEKLEVHQISEKEARIFVSVPRKKRSRLSCRSSSMATQWTTRVIEKQRSITCAEDYKEEERSLKKRRIVRRLGVEPTQQNTTIPEWLVKMMMKKEINGYDPKLIVARKLYKSDTNSIQSRLSMPLNQVVSSDFLTEEETRVIYEQSVLKTRKEGISVVLVDPQLNQHVVDLRKWNMNGNWNYVFVQGWNKVVTKNKFKVGDIYHVWSFRSGEGKLCFALVPPPTQNSEYGHSSSAQTSLSSR